MNHRFLVFLFLLTAFSQKALPQAWSTFLDPSRAIDWGSAGFTIPAYSVACTTQPSLSTGSSAASANASSIQNALNSCDASHNVVNIPAGIWYVAGITYPSHGMQVLRGAGPTATKLISTGMAGCEGYNAGLCMIDSAPVYSASPEALPGGSRACSWTAGYSQGTKTITLSNCGSAPANNQLIILDQIVDQADTGGVYACNETTPASCNYDGTGGSFGRPNRNQTQTAYVTGVTSLGGGSYTVTIAPGVYFTNIQSGRTPGAWWAGGTTTLNGLENLSIDGTLDSTYTLNMYDCYRCWVKGVTFLNGGRASAAIMQSANVVVRDSYFYQAQSSGTSVSYNIETEISSAFLVENNIMQQSVLPMVVNNGTGGVIDYNFAINQKAFASNYLGGLFSSHSGGNQFNLYEGNNVGSFVADDAWGSTNQQTYFRNMLNGWKNGAIGATAPIIHRSYVRGMNIIGNVLGQPGYHTQYQRVATGNTTTSGGSSETLSIYSLGQAFIDSCGTGTAQTSPFCDTLTNTTLMRWGNYDTVNAAVKWDSTEASPGAVTYLSANFSSGYFGSLAHTLPASLYYSSQPLWWPSGKAWPPIGPDVSTGNVGTCTGTYSGAQATSSQCTGGTKNTAWASHVNSIPAQDCFLNVMHGPPDGTGNVLNFDASQCYVSSGSTPGNPTPPPPPTALSGTVI